ncbi:hypothetical protein, partial [Leptospira wolffii]|uniref:hypothetical protein n=1 Tax=Leptospira wolffii TaxID=409998 RepID=UPI0014382E98
KEESKQPIENFSSVRAYVEDIGKKLSEHPDDLKEIISEVIKNSSQCSVFFGIGLALGNPDKSLIWSIILEALSNTEIKDIGILCGFLGNLQKSHSDLVNNILDDLFSKVTFSTHFPRLQLSLEIDTES